MPAPTCFKCRKAQVQCGRTEADAVAWRCDRCGTAGEISQWQGTLWDLRRAGDPVRVVRRSFAVLQFDQHGVLDIDRFGRQQAARFDAWIAPVLGETCGSAGVVEAASRFVAKGGNWTPSVGLVRAIDRAALGYEPCRRL